ncbi:hypothetical protein [Pseudoalteromonas luteoviolacea]|uniref:hypothetical protein n=1 Tax=Pseudoalteromonas luteoviolacea TaxID=43657 RepID=UPI001150A681|nr:hypothetical protein [Pseudoalteromonas luteoviolacea]TQF71312.1 hypothetical protein FLM44_09530 [Pseudoalteromonas luteoviolacea]
MHEFSALALDYLVFQNAYLQKVKSRLGNALSYKCMPAKFTRVGVNAGEYWCVSNLREETLFADGSIFHIKESDLNQEVYGVPDYVANRCHR